MSEQDNRADFRRRQDMWRGAVQWSPGLSPGHKVVLLALQRYENTATGQAYPSNETLAARCNVTRKTVNRALGKGVELGYLERYKRGRRPDGTYYPVRYRFLIPDGVPAWVLDMSIQPPVSGGNVVEDEPPVVEEQPDKVVDYEPWPVKNEPPSVIHSPAGPVNFEPPEAAKPQENNPPVVKIEPHDHKRPDLRVVKNEQDPFTFEPVDGDEQDDSMFLEQAIKDFGGDQQGLAAARAVAAVLDVEPPF